MLKHIKPINENINENENHILNIEPMRSHSMTSPSHSITKLNLSRSRLNLTSFFLNIKIFFVRISLRRILLICFILFLFIYCLIYFSFTPIKIHHFSNIWSYYYNQTYIHMEQYKQKSILIFINNSTIYTHKYNKPMHIILPFISNYSSTISTSISTSPSTINSMHHKIPNIIAKSYSLFPSSSLHSSGDSNGQLITIENQSSYLQDSYSLSRPEYIEYQLCLYNNVCASPNGLYFHFSNFTLYQQYEQLFNNCSIHFGASTYIIEPIHPCYCFWKCNTILNKHIYE
jgi:hypothetical protein